jgi:hypothetical protein
MLKSSSIFKRIGAHLVEKNDIGKKQGLSILGFEWFEHANPFFIYVKL